MCVSLRPAELSDTIVGTFEGQDGRRYLAYQNTARSLVGGGGAATSRKPAQTRRGSSGSRGSSRGRTIAPRRPGNWSFEDAETPALPSTGNAMILPIPDALANISVIDTKTCPDFLKDIRTALTPVSRGFPAKRGGGGFGADAVRIIQSGVYTVVLSESAAQIAAALKGGAVAAEKRPQLDQDILDAYEDWYPDWSIAVCCFSNTDAKRANPLLFSFDPSRQDSEDYFYVPTLDAHDGKRPDLNAEVAVDHCIFVAVDGMSGGVPVSYADNAAPGIAAQLPDQVIGKTVKGRYVNGDVVFQRSDLEKGRFRGLRALPPGAEYVRKPVFV